MDFSGQHIPDNRELFAFLTREQMSIPHGHGDVLMTHELLQFHERHLAGLRQPGGKGMSHGVQGDGVQAVAVFRSQCSCQRKNVSVFSLAGNWSFALDSNDAGCLLYTSYTFTLNIRCLY